MIKNNMVKITRKWWLAIAVVIGGLTCLVCVKQLVPKIQLAEYDLYGCNYDYNETFDKKACFVESRRFGRESSIKLAGSFFSEREGKTHDFLGWNVFLVLRPCDNCKLPKYIEFQTKTLGSTECEITASIDVNNIGKYNQKIYPPEENTSMPNQKLKAADFVSIPVEEYMKNGIDNLVIQSGPNGCGLSIDSFRATY